MKTLTIVLEIDSTVSCVEKFNPGRQCLKLFLSYHKLVGFQVLLYIDTGFFFFFDRSSLLA